MSVVVVQSQRFAALSNANVIRARRRELKARLKCREVLLVDVIREPEWWLFSVPVHELLAWGPRVGSDRVSRVLLRADVWPLRPVGRLTPNQRARLVRELER